MEGLIVISATFMAIVWALIEERIENKKNQ